MNKTLNEMITVRMWILYTSTALHNKFSTVKRFALRSTKTGLLCFPVCCVFWPANKCFACCSQVEIIFFSILTSFTITNRKKETRCKKAKMYTKTEKGVYQLLGVTLKCWLTSKCWWIPGENTLSFIGIQTVNIE